MDYSRNAMSFFAELLDIEERVDDDRRLFVGVGFADRSDDRGRVGLFAGDFDPFFGDGFELAARADRRVGLHAWLEPAFSCNRETAVCIISDLSATSVADRMADRVSFLYGCIDDDHDFHDFTITKRGGWDDIAPLCSASPLAHAAKSKLSQRFASLCRTYDWRQTGWRVVRSNNTGKTKQKRPVN